MKYEIDDKVRGMVISILVQSLLANRTYAEVNGVIAQLQQLKPIKKPVKKPAKNGKG